ncbi:MAG: exodeoxyribonuclease V subunit gamma [Bacteroidota bacterium]|nr:exodeoxyribonuclease V subunit gamma [Bacteroidota bacterium]
MPVILYKNFSLVSDIQAEIKQRIAHNKADTFIFIVPTRRKVRELQREFLKLAPNSTASAFNIFTLENFAAELHTVFCSPKKFLTATTQAVIFENAIRNKANELLYFLPQGIKYSIPKGTFEKIINVINSLKEAGIYPTSLYEELESAQSDEKLKLKDLLIIYEEYESLLGEQFIDVGGIFKELNNTITDLPPLDNFWNRFQKAELILVSGFDEFSDPEITMLDAVSKFKVNKHKNDLGMVISFDYYLNNDELFGHLKENFDKFLRIGFKYHSDQPESKPSFKQHVTQNLFRSDDSILKFDLSEKVTLISSRNREEEVEAIAKVIKNILHNEPEHDLSKICVAMYQPQIYTKLFHEIFPRYGIPVNITDRFALDQSAVAVSIISLLNICQNNFRQRDIMRTLSSSFFTFTDGQTTIDGGNLYAVSVALKITAGKNFWKTRITNRINQIQRDLNTKDDEIEIHHLKNEIDSLQKALNDILLLENFLHLFETQLTPFEFRNALVELLNRLRVPENILKFPTGNFELLEKDTRAYQKFLQLLDDLIDLLTFRAKEKEPQHLKFYIEQLKAAVSQTRYNIRQKYGYGIYITSFEETRGLEFDIMFAIGLVDGEFPPPYSPEIFHSNSRQKKKELYHLTEKRYLLYQCITNFSENLFITYPKKDGDNELVRSPFVNSLLKILDCRDWQKALPEKMTDAVYTEEELLQRIGSNKGINPAYKNNQLLDERMLRHIEFIFKAIEIENSRSMSDHMLEYNGKIYDALSDSSRKSLEKTLDKTYSITQLEKYAKCPFKYFADNILRLNVLEELEEGITPIEKGSILHEVLFQFYVGRREMNLPPLFECNEEQFAEAVNNLIDLTRTKLDSLESSDLLYFLEKELILGRGSRKGIIQEFLDAERDRKLDVVPAYFEVAFGSRVGSAKLTDPELSKKEPVLVGNIKVRGKIDRVEVGNEFFSVVDYKTGSKFDDFADIESGLALQLPIYLFAVEKILSEQNKQLKPAAATYYSLKIPVTEKIALANSELKNKAFIHTRKQASVLDNETELRRIIGKSITYVNEYVGSIAKGEFPITTQEKMPKACEYCSFDMICRKQNKNPINE